MGAFSQEELNTSQGMGLVGFRKEYQHFVFVTFSDRESGRQLLSQLANRVAASWEVSAFKALFSEIKPRYGREGIIGATWIGLALSDNGFQKLGVNLDGEMPAGDSSTAFKQGMAARSAVIGDVRSKDVPTQWKVAFRPPSRVDAVILVASDDKDDLDSTLVELEDVVSDTGCQIVDQAPGATLTAELRGHED